MKDHVVDPQTGEDFPLARERRGDAIAATWSGIYLLVMLALFFWLLFDIWIGRHSWARLLGYQNTGALDTPTFRLMAYSIIGGGLGGIVNGIRSLLFWHSDQQAFGRRFVWKYITGPFLGVTLALFVYAIIRSGMTAFGADLTPQAAGTKPAFAALVVGALAGYGSRQAFIWLDARVKELFKVTLPEEVTVPELINKTQEEAVAALKTARLKAGEVTTEPDDDAKVGKVIRQNPLPDSSVPTNGKVNFTVGIKKKADQAKPDGS